MGRGRSTAGKGRLRVREWTKGHKSSKLFLKRWTKGRATFLTLSRKTKIQKFGNFENTFLKVNKVKPYRVIDFSYICDVLR